MDDVAIIGAGALGSTLAHLLARTDQARAIRLVDDTPTVAAGLALDIMQAAPIERFHTEVWGGSDFRRAAGARLVVVADRTSGSEWTGDEGVALIGRLAQTVPNATFLCAGSTQREVVERGARDFGVPRDRLVGSAPEALVGALRAMVALETRGSPGDVAITVLGVPPDGLIVPWDEVSIAGMKATRFLDTGARRRLERRLPALWPPGPLALATAATRVITSLLSGTPRVVSAFVAPDHTYGRKARAAALPVRLQNAGLAVVDLAGLGIREKVALDNAMLL